MKTSRREKLMSNLALAALIMGVFTTNAHAAFWSSSPAASENNNGGFSLSELKNISPDFEVQKDGNQVTFAGSIPASCAPLVVSSGFADGKHTTTIRPNATCKADDTKRVFLSKVMKPITLEDQSGDIVLRSYNIGADPASKKSARTDDVLIGLDGQPLHHKGSKEIEAEKIAEADKTRADEQTLKDQEDADRQLAFAKRQAQEKLDALTELETAVPTYCQEDNVDVIGIEAELMKHVDELGGDVAVASMVEGVKRTQREALESKISDADNAQDAKDAYEAYLEAAMNNGWDDEDNKVRDAYVEKRLDIASTMISENDGDKKGFAKMEKEIKELMADLKGLHLDKETRTEQTAKFAELFSEIATQAANKGDLANAEKFYDKAGKLAKTDGKIAIKGAMAKIYAEKYKECVKNGPFNAEACEKKYLAKAQGQADSIRDILKQASGEDAESEMSAFEAEYAQTFGSGVTMNVAGYGVKSQVPGMFEQYKATQMQTAMQQAYMSQMMGGQAPATAAPAATTSFLGLK